MKVICCEAETRDMGEWPLMDTMQLTHIFHCTKCNEYYRFLVLDRKIESTGPHPEGGEGYKTVAA